MASFLRGGLISFAAKFSLGKFHGALNFFGSSMSVGNPHNHQNRPVKQTFR